MKLTPESKVLIQGFEQPLVSNYAQQMKAYGTNVVAGVSSGSGGKKDRDIPIFDLVEQAVTAVGAIDTTIIFTPSYEVLDAALEAIAFGIRQIIIVSTGVPPLDLVQLVRKAEACDTLVLGPNSPGIIIPGKILLGTYPQEYHLPGSIGIVSRSSTLTYEIARELTVSGLGQSICVSIGNDGITGSSLLQWLQILDEDENTDAIVLVGEPGGSSEETAARYIAEAIDKPVVAYIAGIHAPVGKNWGHTGALAAFIGRGMDFGTVQSKLDAFKAAKIPVAERPSEIPELINQALTKK